MMTEGIIYLLSNAGMPGLIKIGMTTKENISIRMRELYTAGVPFPFKCEYAARVINLDKVEKALHTAFVPHRINPGREFFEMDIAQAIAIIKLLEIENVTPELKEQSENVDRKGTDAAEEQLKKRPKMNYQEMGIPISAQLVSKRNGEIATVSSDRTVKFREQEMSLTQATRILLENDYNIAPAPYWIYEGRTLQSWYDEKYPKTE